MNSITQTLTHMTSREIAELTDKRHADVMRDIRNMVADLESANANLRWHCESATYTDEQGKPRDQYLLDKDTTLLTGYRADLRLKVIQRWQELEARQIPPAPSQSALEYRQASRAFAALHYKTLTAALRQDSDDPDWECQREANMINRLVLGMSSADFRHFFQVIKPAPIRGCMPAQCLAAFAFLEQSDLTMVMTEVAITKREIGLEKILAIYFPAVVAYRNRQASILAERVRTGNHDLRPEHPLSVDALHQPSMATMQTGMTDAVERIGIIQ